MENSAVTTEDAPALQLQTAVMTDGAKLGKRRALCLIENTMARHNQPTPAVVLSFRMRPLAKPIDAQLQLLLAARKTRTISVQNCSGSTDVDNCTAIGTEGARKRFFFPARQNQKTET